MICCSAEYLLSSWPASHLSLAGLRCSLFQNPPPLSPTPYSYLICLLFSLSTCYISQKAEGFEGALIPAVMALHSKKEMVS